MSPVIAWSDEGEYGRFDFRRSGVPLCHINEKYRKSYFFGIGVYANGAGVDESSLDAIMGLVEGWVHDHPQPCP